MSWFTKILRFEFNSAFARFLLSFYYKEDRFYKIPFGKLQGLRIWYDKSINYHAILGLWERDNFELIEKILKEQKRVIVFDIGANIGLFSLFFSRIGATQVVAFEAVAETANVLLRNCSVNEITNVKVETCAVSGEDGQATFFVGHHHKSSLVKDWASNRGVSHTEEITVDSIRMDTYVRKHPDFTPGFIKIDVEGGGGQVLAGAREVLASARPIVLFESHLPAEDNAVITMIKELHYKAYRVDNREWVVNEDQNFKDRGGVWGTMILFPREKVEHFDELLRQ